jgi:hypothetical protein
LRATWVALREEAAARAAASTSRPTGWAQRWIGASADAGQPPPLPWLRRQGSDRLSSTSCKQARERSVVDRLPTGDRCIGSSGS